MDVLIIRSCLIAWSNTDFICNVSRPLYLNCKNNTEKSYHITMSLRLVAKSLSELHILRGAVPCEARHTENWLSLNPGMTDKRTQVNLGKCNLDYFEQSQMLEVRCCKQSLWSPFKSQELNTYQLLLRRTKAWTLLLFHRTWCWCYVPLDRYR